ncbi:guanylin [Delphinus delphis]|uniref:guanylin n=1 Tax=Delphinus delphis TaxID=9728 RepID=UPI0028C38E3C|nr:guanylin [Delphinus delphis]
MTRSPKHKSSTISRPKGMASASSQRPEGGPTAGETHAAASSGTKPSSLLGAAATNTFLLSALCLLGAWAALAGGVTVKDGEFSFSLESVKKLKDLQQLQEPRRSRNTGGSLVPILCSSLRFPEELKPLCKEPNAQEILERLEAIAEDPSTCEICAYAACAGC